MRERRGWCAAIYAGAGVEGRRMLPANSLDGFMGLGSAGVSEVRLWSSE